MVCVAYDQNKTYDKYIRSLFCLSNPLLHPDQFIALLFITKAAVC